MKNGKFQENVSRPVIDARARYGAAAPRLRNTVLRGHSSVMAYSNEILCFLIDHYVQLQFCRMHRYVIRYRRKQLP